MAGQQGFGLVHRVVFPPSGATGSQSAIITGRYKDSGYNIQYLKCNLILILFEISTFFISVFKCFSLSVSAGV